jgi:Polymerase beta, Nucleotidyltransferase
VPLLFGSRARGNASSLPDWDFGYLADDGMGLPTLLGALVAAVGTDRVDLVDLQRASGLLRYRAARDGHTVFEASPGLADRFRLEAADFWCDAISVLRRGYEDVLVELPGERAVQFDALGFSRSRMSCPCASVKREAVVCRMIASCIIPVEAWLPAGKST